MLTFEATIGEAEATVFAPAPAEFDPAVFRAVFPAGQLYGLDVESTALTDLAQFDPDFRVRLVQFGTVGYAWVLRMDDPAQRAAAAELLADPTTAFCSHTEMDVLTVLAEFGVDIAERNLDTRMLANMVDTDDHAKADLKELVTKHLGPELEEAEAELTARFKELWPGRKNAKGSDIAAFGWNEIPTDDPAYLKYAGLDAIAVRRLVDVLLPATEAPAELLKVEQWLAAQAVRIQARGMLVDRPMLEEFAAEARREFGGAKQELIDLTGVNPLGSNFQPWLAEHGVDWSTWEERGGALTATGNPSLAKENVKLLEAYELDQDGRKAYEILCRMKQHQDADTKLNGPKGVVRKVGPDNRVHPTLITNGAKATSRMSSAGPNFQNFSKRDPRMRGLFLPEPGHVLLTADFDQVELRVVAGLAQEGKMISTILAGGDLHQLTVDEVAEAGITISRDTGKMTNFLIVYGGGGKALSQQALIPRDEADRIVQAHRERYPAIQALTYELGQYETEIRTISHRRLMVKTWRDRSGRTGKAAYANINYAVQSAARDLLVGAWWRFAHEFGYGRYVWFPVHDELILQVPEDEVEAVKQAVEACMRMDFLGVPITASAVELRDETGRSRWMTSKRAEAIAKAKEAA